MYLLKNKFKVFGTVLLLILFTHAKSEEIPVISWGFQLGSSAEDIGWEIIVDNDGNSYIAGTTEGKFASVHYGKIDWHSSGTYRTIWDASDEYNQSVSSGIYIYQLDSQGYSDMKKMILLR
jgi:hypothetical protein